LGGGTIQVLEEKKTTPGGAARLICKVKRETKRKFNAEEKNKNLSMKIFPIALL
jgi:hypothetical protein